MLARKLFAGAGGRLAGVTGGCEEGGVGGRGRGRGRRGERARVV
jgi:hypothetical protein